MIKFSKHCSWTASVGVETSESVCFLYSVLKHVTRGFIFLFIYIELSLRVCLLIIKAKPYCSRREKANFVWIATWKRLDVAWKSLIMHVEIQWCLSLHALPVTDTVHGWKSPAISVELKNIDGVFADFGWFVPNFTIHK
jgi:hypothetical protein